MNRTNHPMHTLINNLCKVIAITAISIYSFHHVAEAGTLTDGKWSSSKCGSRPVAPALDLKNEDAYNKSVNAINTYRQQVAPYLECVVSDANADIQTINTQAKNEQLAIQEANNKISEDVKIATEKFK
ncbi:hypothetical protein LG201_00135 [Methylobacillus gramineus]|uniref:hypothetical protein n=1 Tax=Methylobacillus gramineus TaxID=755169 RepID=UPI001CFF9858|nr:hypothetical protein [Methylobacillus gramineus]MCB5183613.1 hypothetical protein [Methylobacillus gramineus]